MDKASHQLVKIMLYDLVENGLLTSAEAEVALQYYMKKAEKDSEKQSRENSEPDIRDLSEKQVEDP